MENKDRDKVIDEFRNDVFPTLISTNVLARGIDVPQVDLIINFDIPIISSFGFKDPDFANYLHRVGRTGRFGTDGLAVTFYVDDVDKVEENFIDQIEKHYAIEIKEISSFEELT